MRFLFHVLPCLVLLLASAPTSAQSDSAIFGTVIDAVTRRPLTNVVVILRSPALKQEAVLVTDDQGSFRFPNLPPGPYALRFEQDHYHPHVRNDLQLREGRSLRARVALVWDPNAPVIW
ncbi:carboxypeptidase regulatory-like domain-containing protein [Corallococcus sp. CA049B]|uniref:carboxypeptidase-like regulatory domain-containing protein n=1 Tax=Corallococcus sp. CA049B TaxID=2316730 RepID=UPI000EA09E42|nr:carboxypeptidase-like regulatory domain-containing protein [Corallococcus sp. CA049B]NOJ92411.1 carboxypeptidase regulatory-like domain-containing protein [Corallococcus coralloides]RKG87224.1 carboxypeptidase regulatory-like domain-containing protein [Corallococcus sp. CA049B]